MASASQLKALALASGHNGLSLKKVGDFLNLTQIELFDLINFVNMNDEVLELKIVGGKIFCTLKEEYKTLLRNFGISTFKDLSKPLIETLALVSYLQPCSKEDLKILRGVDSSQALSALQDLGLVKEENGSYLTTLKFLETLQIANLEELEDFEKIRGEFKEGLQDTKI